MKTTEERFYEKVMMIPFHECWEWAGSQNGDGYGLFWWNKKVEKAHRASYKINIGTIPDGMHVLHTCDNPSCVNPDHLFIGTNTDNVNDKVKKGRQVFLRGSKNGNSKINEEQAGRIKQLLKQMPPKEVSKLMPNVTIDIIWDISRGRTWRHI